ncbi:DoxX family protein [Streptomyces sp. tea 10]|nr:DoxX family protein [Streptomyces sp. tea 10]
MADLSHRVDLRPAGSGQDPGPGSDSRAGCPRRLHDRGLPGHRRPGAGGRHRRGPLGRVVPLYGGLAGIGLLMLLAGAVITHVREGDGLPKLVPAVACAALVAWYLVLLADL